MTNQLYSLLLLLGILCYATSQKFPDIACPKYFEYERNGNQYIGKITLPNAHSGSTKLDVKISVPVVLQSSQKSRISLYTDRSTTQSNIRNGIPPSYRLEFPTSNVLPKITLISINHFVICADKEYTAPSTTVHLQHTLEGAGTGLSLNPTAMQIFDAICGHEGTITRPFIHGGYTVERGQYPWMTAIYQIREEEEDIDFICGGSLISSRTIISAAHCFTLHGLKPNEISVILGQYNISDHSAYGVVRRNVIKLIIHPEYNPRLIADADVALAHLDSPVSFSEYISPICLWNEPPDENAIHNIRATVAGWGGDELGRSFTPLPKRVGATIVREIDCIHQNKFYLGLTSNRTICAGNLDNSGPCMGDSGGGLMIERGGTWVLRGIVSIGRSLKGQCDLRDYVIYCDVAKHITWVRDNKLE